MKFHATNSNAFISKSKSISSIFFCLSGIYIIFAMHWKKSSASEVISFWNNRLEKAELLKCPKSPVSQHLWTVTILIGPKHCLNLPSSIFVIFLITLIKNQVQKLCFISIWNYETVCYHIDTRWEVFSLSKSECLIHRIQTQFSQNLEIFSEFFFPFPESTWNLECIDQKVQLQRLFLSEIIDWKKRSSLNAQEAPCQNTYGQSTC